MRQMGRLRGRGRVLAARADRQPLSPMANMSNLVTAIIVFICGLLISIVMNWNVSLDGLMMIVNKDQLVEIELPKGMEEQLGDIESFEEVGEAVADPQTGQVYVLEDE